MTENYLQSPAIPAHAQNLITAQVITLDSQRSIYHSTLAISPPPNFISSIKIRNAELGPRVSDLQPNLPNLPETAPILCKCSADNAKHHNYYPAQPHKSNYDTSLQRWDNSHSHASDLRDLFLPRPTLKIKDLPRTVLDGT